METLKRCCIYITKRVKQMHRKSFNRNIKAKLKQCGKDLSVEPSLIHMGLDNISIGDNFKAGERLKLRTFEQWGEIKFTPSITIGDNVNIETDCHISAINKVSIGNNVLMASFVYISDHAHGCINDYKILSLPPLKRPLYSKGPVVIDDDVWLGEKVSIMPGVHIGQGAIIGANSVVTKDIPPYTVAAGTPARVIKTLK